MKVLADTRLYPPSCYAGAELAMHNLLRALTEQGHECNVVVREGGDAQLDGIQVWALPDDSTLVGMYEDADVVISHLEAALHAQTLCARAGTPLVHLCHNDTQLRWNHTLTGDLIVFNSQTLRSACAGQHPGIDSTILNPIVRQDDVVMTAEELESMEHLARAHGNDCLQVSLSDLKGGFTFWRLAAREPERRFVAILGGYGEQINRGGDNVTVVNHLDHKRMRLAYASARVLLVPSAYETWGRVAVEAMANGLPLIAHPSPGLMEAAGPGGVQWAHRDNPDEWSTALKLLDHPEEYQLHSERSVSRWHALQEQQERQTRDVIIRLEELAR